MHFYFIFTRFERHDFLADLFESKESLLPEGNIEIKEVVVNRLLKWISVNSVRACMMLMAEL